jgi:hypothetical protein
MSLALVSILAGCGAPASSPSAASTAAPSEASAPSAAASPSASTATASPTTASSPAAAATRIPVPGGPIGLDVAAGHAWVVATDAGRIVDVDLASGATTPMDVGSSANWVKVLGDTKLVVSRYGPADGRATLEIIDAATGKATPITQEPIDALDLDSHGIWAFQKDGTVLSVDGDGRTIGQAQVEIAPNEHIDLVGTGDAVFASSDSTPVRRVAGGPLSVDATIETGGGVPFTSDRGLIWGARPDELWGIDPSSGTVTKRFPLANVMEILDLDVDGDDAWIAVRHPGRMGAVIRLDLATGTQVADIPARLPAAVVIDGKRAWVTDYEAGELLGFDR